MEYTRILKKGSSGEDVKYIQNCLISINYSCGASGADGKFGRNTEKAVISYQKNHKDDDSAGADKPFKNQYTGSGNKAASV